MLSLPSSRNVLSEDVTKRGGGAAKSGNCRNGKTFV